MGQHKVVPAVFANAHRASDLGRELWSSIACCLLSPTQSPYSPSQNLSTPPLHRLPYLAGIACGYVEFVASLPGSAQKLIIGTYPSSLDDAMVPRSLGSGLDPSGMRDVVRDRNVCAFVVRDRNVCEVLCEVEMCARCCARSISIEL